MKLLFKIEILTFLIISLSYEACIPGENCPYNQGECQDDQCICKNGFFTLIDSSKAITDQVFCDYEQISMKLMLLMEVLLPGSGQIYSKRWLHGIIKFCIFVSFVIVSVVFTKTIYIPKCFIIAKNALIGGGGEEGGNDNQNQANQQNQQNENNEELEENDANNLNDNGNQTVANFISDCMSLQGAENIRFGGTPKCKKISYIFSRIIIYLFWTVYSLDIYLIFFLIYSDGEGIPYSG